MKKSLDLEPPSIRETKEVSVKKGNHNQLILLLKDEKIKSKPVNSVSGKNLEKQVRIPSQDYLLEGDYMRTSSAQAEEISTTLKAVSFTKIADTNPNLLSSEFNSSYSQRISTTEIIEKKSSNFYSMTSSYSFIPKAREEEKRDDLSSQPREQDVKEVHYILYNFDEEPKPEN